MTAEAKLLTLLQGGGYAVQEAGWGPVCFGSDQHTYAARTARALQRKKLAELRWGDHGGNPASWAWVATNAGVKEDQRG